MDDPYADWERDEYLDAILGEYDGVFEKEAQAVTFLSRLYDDDDRPIDRTFQRVYRGVFSPLVRDHIKDLRSRRAYRHGYRTRKYDARSQKPYDDLPEEIETAIAMENEIGGNELMYELASEIPSLRVLHTGDSINMEQARAEFPDVANDPLTDVEPL